MKKPNKLIQFECMNQLIKIVVRNRFDILKSQNNHILSDFILEDKMSIGIEESEGKRSIEISKRIIAKEFMKIKTKMEQVLCQNEILLFRV